MRNYLTQVSSLCALVSVLSTSCLVSGAPPLEGKEQISPRVVADSVSPPPLVIVPTTSASDTAATPFKAYFWSEDLGEGVVGALYIDEISESTFLRQSFLEGGSLSDTDPRAMEIVWEVRRNQTPGCHFIIMVIGHESTFTDKLVPKTDAYDQITFVTWTISHDLPPYEVSLEDCPQPGVDPGMNE